MTLKICDVDVMLADGVCFQMHPSAAIFRFLLVHSLLISHTNAK